MRYLLITLILCLIIFSCNNKKSNSTYLIGKSDTTKPMVVFYDQFGVRRFDAVFRVVIDTFKVVKENGKLITSPVTDSLYFPPLQLKATDSLGAVIKTAAGKDSMIFRNIIVKREDIIFDTGIDYNKIDSLLKAGNKIKIGKQ